MRRWVLHTAFRDDCSVCSSNVFVLFSFFFCSWSSESCHVPRGLEGECSDCCVAEAGSLGGFYSRENSKIRRSDCQPKLDLGPASSY
ncbi:BnaA06g39140D [Brassica napus]|uniref:BnaA06g39140D protein n=1 Tax=Brassica napus TaxID=3708 RepID=A0A078JY93_BRANA|nr:BnaA06g39140D [Brassica napus]